MADTTVATIMLLIDLSHICSCLQVLWQTSEQQVGLNLRGILLMWLNAIFCRDLVFVGGAFVCSFVFDIRSNCLGLIPLSNDLFSCNWFLPGTFASFRAAVCDQDITGNGFDLFFEHEVTHQQCWWIRQDYCEGWESKTTFNLDSWHWKSVFEVVRRHPLNRLVFKDQSYWFRLRSMRFLNFIDLESAETYVTFRSACSLTQHDHKTL